MRCAKPTGAGTIERSEIDDHREPIGRDRRVPSILSPGKGNEKEMPAKKPERHINARPLALSGSIGGLESSPSVDPPAQIPHHPLFEQGRATDAGEVWERDADGLGLWFFEQEVRRGWPP